MAATFSYSYAVTYDTNTGTYSLADTIDHTKITDGQNPGDYFITLTDNIHDGIIDDPSILGNSTNAPDTFSWAITDSDGTHWQTGGTASYVNLASSPFNNSSGFIIDLGTPSNHIYFYVTNEQITDANGSNGLLTITPGEEVICFMPGTMIRTPEREVPVETLKRGDLVTTTDGRAMPVTWVGRQTISRLFADPVRVLPIRIKAGALAEATPSRDLLISPDHAVLVDGALIQAGALVNGTSIVRETAVPTIFTYFHVELDDHSLILAENTPAETFVDNVDRLNFDNWAEHQALYPEGKAVEELPYPRAKAQRQVPVAIRVKLAERAQAIGTATGVAAA